MHLYCIEEFKLEFEKLISKKAYKDLEKEIIDFFFDKNVADISSGTRLNGNDHTPYIKKRLSGKGGFRVYYYLVIKNDCVYLMFVHPKTGPMGSPNITDESKAFIYKKVLDCIKDDNLYKLTKDKISGKIIFTKKS